MKSRETTTMRRNLLGEGAWVAVGVGVGLVGGWLTGAHGVEALGTPIEVFAVITGALSVWLLGSNRVSGWWIGIASVIAFIWVFWQVRLYGEVAIQIFYAGTSLAAIRLWLRNRLRSGDGGGERPVTSVPKHVLWGTAAAVATGVAATRWVLAELGGAAPFWDAVTTVGSVAAHMWLVGRWTQAWWIWITLDVIYVPLYLSRGLTLTSGLYVVFLILAIRGLARFKKLERSETEENSGETAASAGGGLGEAAA